MEKLTEVRLKKPLVVPSGDSVTEFKDDGTVSIRREPVDAWPAKLIIEGTPWGRLECDWEEHMGTFSLTHVLGPNPFTDVPQTDADGFLSVLTDPSLDDGRHLFRGLPDASHELVPSALRGGLVAATNLEQVAREERSLLRFFEVAYYQGLTIPNWDQVSTWADFVRQGRRELPWPPRHLHHFMAIAQHHRVPTRLLDWSLDPLVAAYFAVVAGPVSKNAPAMAVWILNKTAYGGRLFRGRIAEPIAVPYDLNRNAHAQRGVFTLHLTVDRPDGAPSTEKLDSYLSRLSDVEPTNGLRRVTLPRSETAALFRLLNRRRISGGTLFPGYDGAARGAIERDIWDP